MHKGFFIEMLDKTPKNEVFKRTIDCKYQPIT